MLSIHRHEVAGFFWSLWGAAQGNGPDDLWSVVTPVINRLDLLCEDTNLQASHRGAISPAVIALRERRGASREAVEEHLRRLANTILSMLDAEYAFRPCALAASTYLAVMRAAVRAFNAGTQYLSHSATIDAVARYARIDRPIVEAAIGRMVDEGLIEYAFEGPNEDEPAFRIIDDEAIDLRIEELEEGQMLQAKVTVTHAEPLRPDYEKLIHGLALKHDVVAEGSPTGSEIILVVSDYGGDAESFKTRLAAFANEVEVALSRAAPSHAAPASTSVTIHGSVINSGVQAGSAGALQQVRTDVSIDVGQLRACFASAKEALDDADLDDETREIVDSQLATIEKQLAKQAPNPKLLLPLVTTVAAALSSAGAVGQGLDYLHKLANLLGGLM